MGGQRNLGPAGGAVQVAAGFGIGAVAQLDEGRRQRPGRRRPQRDDPACATRAAPRAVRRAVQRQVQHAQVAAGIARHAGGLAGQPPCHRIDAGGGGHIGAGKQLMGVARDHRIHAGQGGQRQRRILGHRIHSAVGAADAGMAQGDHHLGPGGDHPGQDLARGLDNALGAGAAIQMCFVPDRDLRRQKARDPQPDRPQPALIVADLPVQHRPAGKGRRAIAAVQVRAQQRKPRPGQRRIQKPQAKVEIVVPQRHGIIAQQVHRLNHRMRAVGLGRVGFGQGIAQGAALQEVAIVQQQGIGRRRPQSGDVVRDRGKAGPRRRPVAVMVPGTKVEVKIAGGEDRHLAAGGP